MRIRILDEIADRQEARSAFFASVGRLDLAEKMARKAAKNRARAEFPKCFDTGNADLDRMLGDRMEEMHARMETALLGALLEGTP